MGEGLKNNLKKYFPYIVGAAAVVIVIILAISLFTAGPKKVVKQFIKARNEQDIAKMIDIMDFKGVVAWLSYSFDTEDFDKEDYEDFIENYNTDDYIEMEKMTKEMMEDMYEKLFDTIENDFKYYECEFEKIESVEKLGKDLYAVKTQILNKAAKLEEDSEELSESITITFIVYNNKIIEVPWF